ncbi:GGDEF domain-containing protein [Marinococcus sp. PL1-022]|uniref:GGDEF domain-containing protein n=1 Tax=Marinococcus sp. PL1-022 TaxID=3095363 RepID=UPI0029C4B008|nr:GGDEF domain-containing protein [Marinococcus sp. PL1-022]MDX6152658.1 GGDEF domain-containing protein [Marinococcus sp. PL1-022]
MPKAHWNSPGFLYVFRFLASPRDRGILYGLYVVFVGVLFVDSIVAVAFSWPVLAVWVAFVSSGLYWIHDGHRRQVSIPLTLYLISCMGWWGAAVLMTGGLESPLVHYGQVLWVLSALSASLRLNVIGGLVLGLTLAISLGMTTVTGNEMLEMGSVMAIHGLTLAFGALVAVAMQRQQGWIAHWQVQAQTDHLTGLPNRSGWLDWWQRVAPTAGWLGEMDVNNFKAMNDTYGHARGDQVLVEMAEELQRSLPGEALAARIGGDEFIVFLPANMSEAKARTTVSELTKRAGAAANMPITAALGLVPVTSRHCDFQDLYRQADRNMYYQKEAKRAGSLEASMDD